MHKPHARAALLAGTALLVSFPAATQSPGGTPLPPPIEGRTPVNELSPLGINLAEISYWSTEWVFVDLFKRSMPWLPQRVSNWDWNTGEVLDLDSDGWVRSLNPDQAAGALIAAGSRGNYPGGRYLCFYDGDGDLEFHYDARAVKRQPGRIEVDVRPTDAGIYVKLVRTNPAYPLRNIRLVMPGFEAAHLLAPFHPRFLERWRTFKVLRFMDWAHTNNSKVRSWSQRTRPTAQTQGRSTGIAPEYMILLANTLDADPWLTIPHLADDDYVRQLALLARDHVEPGRKIWVEYSNEVWNGDFAQHHHAAQQGLALGLAGDAWTAALRFYARRSVEIFQIFVGVFGDTHRLVRVLAAQNANPAVGKEIMDWQGAHRSADVLAVAPYFGDSFGEPARQTEVAKLSVEELLLALLPGIPATVGAVQQNFLEATNRGLRLVAYEGGQHLAGRGSARENAALTDLFHRANRHPAMGWLNYFLLEGWRASGGTMFVTFNSLGHYSKYGAWGLCETETADPLGSPKYWAHALWAGSRPRWW
jgi:hypothetical protein